MKFSALLSVISSFDKSSVKATFINHFCEYDCILLVFLPIQSVFISFFHFCFELFLLLSSSFHFFSIRTGSVRLPPSSPCLLPNSLRLSQKFGPSFTQFSQSFTQFPPSSTQATSVFHPISFVFHSISFDFHPVLTISLVFIPIKIASNGTHLMCCK